MATKQLTFCDDASLGYFRSLTPLADGDALTLDPSYRLAHLPLVNPMHPDVIPSIPSKDYSMGQHQCVYSLVMPIPIEELENSKEYKALQTVFKNGPLANKLAWDILPRRQDKLHATLCGGLAEGEEKPELTSIFRNILKSASPFEVELRGILSGNINVGRLYIKAYPEIRNGLNMIQLIQRALGRNETDLYLVGLHNLTDHLDAAQTRWLMRLIKDWWDKPILRFTVTELWLLSSKDDLVLDSRIEEKFELNSFDAKAI